MSLVGLIETVQCAEYSTVKCESYQPDVIKNESMLSL